MHIPDRTVQKIFVTLSVKTQLKYIFFCDLLFST